MCYEICAICDKGKRLKNDDAVCVEEYLVLDNQILTLTLSKPFTAVVSDGVSKSQHGADASKLIVEKFSSLIRHSAKNDYIYSTEEGLPEFINDINSVLTSSGDDYHATIAGIHISGKNFVIFNVGDSNVYSYIKPYFNRETISDTLADQMVRESGFSADEAEPYKDILSEYMGNSTVKPHVSFGKLTEEPLFVLCTDGLDKYVSDIEFEHIIKEEKNLSAVKLAKQFYSTAIKNGSDDNISIVVIKKV